MKKKVSKVYFAGSLVGVVSLFGWYFVQPGDLDSFAECLGEQGATFYGAFWCPHCKEQKTTFGKSANKIPYVECSTPDGQRQTEQCRDAGIKSYPTWIFADGEQLHGPQTTVALSEKTGCQLPDGS